MPKAYFVGTNGWYDSDLGSTVCTLIDYPEFNLILDAGGGFAKLEGCIQLDKPTYLFLSHLHLDHIVGLHVLPKYRFKHDLHILLSENSVKALTTFMDFPYTAPARLFKEYLNYDIRIIPLPTASGDLPFKVTILPLIHTVETMAARFEVEGKTVSYVIDTGYCENAIRISEMADLLIAECSHRPGETNLDWPHLNPEEAAEIAARSSCSKLVLIHFDAKRYPTMASRMVAEDVAKNIFQHTTAGYDGLVCEF